MEHVEICAACERVYPSPIYGLCWHSTDDWYPAVDEWHFVNKRLFWTEHYGVAVIQCERANLIQCGDEGIDPERCWKVKEIPNDTSATPIEKGG